MFFEDISAFVAVVRAGSFSKAAIDACVAQSALSRRVKRIESRMGTVLLERNARGVVLTEAGKLFLSRVEKIVDEISDMEANLSTFVKEPAGKVRIAFPPRSSGLLAPRVYKKKLATLPLVQLEFLEGPLCQDSCHPPISTKTGGKGHSSWPVIPMNVNKRYLINYSPLTT